MSSLQIFFSFHIVRSAYIHTHKMFTVETGSLRDGGGQLKTSLLYNLTRLHEKILRSPSGSFSRAEQQNDSSRGTHRPNTRKIPDFRLLLLLTSHSSTSTDRYVAHRRSMLVVSKVRHYKKKKNFTLVEKILLASKASVIPTLILTESTCSPCGHVHSLLRKYNMAFFFLTLKTSPPSEAMIRTICPK